MTHYSKKIRKEIRTIVELAYERALTQALNALSEEFTDWKNNSISVWQLNEAIHLFYKGPSRDLYRFYVNNSFPESVVARSFVNGLLTEDDLSDELLALIEPQCLMIRQSLERDKTKMTKGE